MHRKASKMKMTKKKISLTIILTSSEKFKCNRADRKMVRKTKLMLRLTDSRKKRCLKKTGP